MKMHFNKTRLASIAKNYGLKFIILHGSYANGSPDKESDLDIAVLAEKPLDFNAELKLHGLIEQAFSLPPSGEFDFKTLNRVDPFFRYQVVRQGKLLYGNKTDYEDYKAFAQRAFLEDARPLLELEQHLAYKFQKHLNQLYVK